jgi:SAM-dependent methyltransferase
MDAERHAERQRRFYDSREHEHLRAGEEDLYARNLVSQLVASLGIGPSDRVLELGAGFGRFTFPLLDHCASVVAVDLSPVALEQLVQVRDDRSIPKSRIDTHCLDLDTLEVDSLGERFDFIVGFFLLHHLADIRRSIAGLAPLLSASGRMGFLEPNRRNPLFLAQVAACKDMSWAEESGMFRLSERSVLDAYRDAGLEQTGCNRCGFFPPQIFNRVALARRLESRLERSRVLQPLLPFLILTARARQSPESGNEAT